MFLRKLCFLTMLTVIVASAGVGKLDTQKQKVDLLPDLKPRHAAPLPVRSLSFVGGLSDNQPGPHRGKVSAANSAIVPALYLPVRSTEAKNLGAGKLLVARRDLGDPNFAQTVVLLVRYDDEGVVGLILNRRTRVPLSRVFDALQAAKDRSDPVYLGGPVEKPAVLALLHSKDKLEGAEHVFDGVYLISKKPLFDQVMSARSDPSVLHVYLGYAGWNNLQLQREVELGSWFIFPADAKTVFDSDPDSLWSRMIAKTELQVAASGPEPW